MNKNRIERIVQTENDPLELKKYVDCILRELNEQDTGKLNFKGYSIHRKKVKKGSEPVELRELPFVF